MGEGKKIFARPCPVSRHRWAHAGGQSRGMLRGGGGGGAPQDRGLQAGKLRCRRCGSRWQGAPAQRVIGRRAGLPLVGLACGHGASWVSSQDPCRAGGALWWPTATPPPGSRGPAKHSSENSAQALDERKGAKTTICCASGSWSLKQYDNCI